MRSLRFSLIWMVFFFGGMSCQVDSAQEQVPTAGDVQQADSLATKSVFIPNATGVQAKGLLAFSLKVPDDSSALGLADEPKVNGSWSWDASIDYTSPAGKIYKKSGSLNLVDNKGTASLPAVDFGAGRLSLTLKENGQARYSGATNVDINASTKTVALTLYPMTGNVGIDANIQKPTPTASAGPSEKPSDKPDLNTSTNTNTNVNTNTPAWNARSNLAIDDWKIEFLPTN